MKTTITIEKIIHGGQGLGRMADGKIVLVPFVLPGEKVQVRETASKRGYNEAEPVVILEPSPFRADPPCPLFQRCGGCNLQHMTLAAQHRAKEEVVHESLNRAGVSLPAAGLSEIIPSPQPLHYRYRIRLWISPPGVIGFYRAGSHEIIDIQTCPVAVPSLNNALAGLRSAGTGKILAPYAREIELLASPADSRVTALLPVKDPACFSTAPLREHLSTTPGIDGWAFRKGWKIRLLNPEEPDALLSQVFSGDICGHPFSLEWTPGCFFQVNALQNEALIRLACRLAGKVDNTPLLDLFCGMGNFSIPLALRGARVTGIERSRQSITSARRNSSQLVSGVHPVFIDTEVRSWLAMAVNKDLRFPLVILDPPRQGMGREIQPLVRLSPDRILYISCDPATLARDIRQLSKAGYILSSLTPVDMFPQTHHIECAALLEKN